MPIYVIYENLKWLIKNNKELVIRDIYNIKHLLDLISNGSDLSDIVQRDLGLILQCYLKRYCDLFHNFIKNEINEDFLYDFYDEISYCENEITVIDNIIKNKSQISGFSSEQTNLSKIK